MRSSRAYFTWNNKQEGEEKVYNRIDRVVVNTEWITTLPNSQVHFMNEGLYDHCSANINWKNGKQKCNRQFKYYNMWTLAPEFKDKVKKSWEGQIGGDKLFQVIGKMNSLKAVLLKLNNKRFSDIERKAEQAMEGLKQYQLRIQGDISNKALIKKEIQLAKECRL